MMTKYEEIYNSLNKIFKNKIKSYKLYEEYKYNIDKIYFEDYEKIIYDEKFLLHRKSILLNKIKGNPIVEKFLTPFIMGIISSAYFLLFTSYTQKKYNIVEGNYYLEIFMQSWFLIIILSKSILINSNRYFNDYRIFLIDYEMNIIDNSISMLRKNKIEENIKDKKLKLARANYCLEKIKEFKDITNLEERKIKFEKDTRKLNKEIFILEKQKCILYNENLTEKSNNSLK